METTSFKSKLYRAAIRLTGIKKRIEKEFQTGDFSHNNKAASIPDKVQRHCAILYRKSTTGRAIWELTKKGTEPQRYILYLHGGAFVHNLTSYDWQLVSKIIQSTGYGIIVPDYPLAPEHTYKDVYGMVVPIYEELLGRVGSDNVVLMGFSAGGGLTLSLAQYAKDQSLAQPAKLILLSPLLDARLQNPEILIIDKHDPYLSKEGLKKALLAYSAGDVLSHYQISPINGPLEGLAPIHLFMGTHELLLPDARKLVELANKQQVHIAYNEYPQHVSWMDFPQYARSKECIQQTGKYFAIRHYNPIDPIEKSSTQHTIEVFATSVKNEKEAKSIKRLFKASFPHLQLNFDLKDCDHIFRVAGPCIDCEKVFKGCGHNCKRLE